MKKFAVLIIFSWFFYLQTLNSFVFGQNDGDETSTNNPVTDDLNSNWSYCFEFTWIGPEFNKDSLYNGSCADYTDDYRIKDAPCVDPLVITTEGTLPDIEYLWKNHQKSVVCKRSDTQVCARYTYKFDGKYTNATYMCTKVLSMGEDKPATSGCYKQKMRGYEVEICICKSGQGVYRPCNSAWLPKASLALILFTLSYIYLF